MDDVLEKADDLARAIRASDRYRTLREIETELADDDDTKGLMRDLEEAQKAIAEKEQSGQPIEVADKHRIRDVQEKVSGNARLMKLLQAQADFYDMMNRVNGAIQSVLGGDGED